MFKEKGYFRFRSCENGVVKPAFEVPFCVKLRCLCVDTFVLEYRGLLVLLGGLAVMEILRYAVHKELLLPLPHALRVLVV